jgi:metallo-beta-lactamase family protein
MCDEGRVTNLLDKHLPNENTISLLTGFQAKETNGLLLKKLSNNEYNEEQKKSISLSLKIIDEQKRGKLITKKEKNENIVLEDIKCKILDMSEFYSGHADQEQLLDYLTPPEEELEKLKERGETLGTLTVLLNHGTIEARTTLKEKIKERNKDARVILPEFNQWFNVSTFMHEPEDIDFESDKNKYVLTKAGDIHIYFPTGYDDEKIRSTIEFINKL